MARQYKTGLIITGDASGGIRAVQATEKELGRLNRGFDRGARQARTYQQRTGDVSRELAVLRRAAAPVAAAVAGLFAADTLRRQVDFGSGLADISTRIGASADALSQYNYVAQQSGVQFNTLTTAWQRQTRRINEAARGTGVASDALKRLGLNAQTLASLRPEDQFEAIARAMEAISDEGERVALAQKLWDSGGVQLLQMTNQGAAAMREMREEADRLGLTITQQTAEDMSRFGTELNRVKFAAQGVSQSLLVSLIPAMTNGLQAANEFIGGLRSGELERTAQALNVVAGATGGVAAAYLVLRGAILATTAAQWALNAAMRANPLMLAVSAASALVGVLVTTRSELNDTARQARQTADEVRGLAQGFEYLSRAQQQATRTRVLDQLTEWRLAAAELGSEIAQLQAQARQSGQLTEQGGAMPIMSPEAMARGRQARDELAGLLTQIAAGNDALADMDQVLQSVEDSGTGAVSSLQDLGSAADKAANQLEQRYDSLAAQLEREKTLYGETSRTAQLRYDLERGELRGLTSDRQAYLISLSRELEAMQDLDRLLGDYLPQLERLRTLQRDAAAIDELDGGLGNLAARQLEREISELATRGLQVPTNIDASIAGPFGEAERLDREMDRYREQYEQRLEILRELSQEEHGVRAEALAAMAELERRHLQTTEQYERQSQRARLAGQASMYGDLAGLARVFAGEQSSIYRGLFVAHKAYSLASTMVSSFDAISKAWASAPFPANVPIVAKTAMETGALAAALSAVQPVGMAHKGMDRIPREGTWLLDRGERVYTNESARRVDEVHDRVMTMVPEAAGPGSDTSLPSAMMAMTSAAESIQHFLARERRAAAAGGGGGGQAPITVDVEVINQGQPVDATATVDRIGEDHFRVRVLQTLREDLAGGGSSTYAEQFASAYNIKRGAK